MISYSCKYYKMFKSLHESRAEMRTVMLNSWEIFLQISHLDFNIYNCVFNIRYTISIFYTVRLYFFEFRLQIFLYETNFPLEVVERVLKES